MVRILVLLLSLLLLFGLRICLNTNNEPLHNLLYILLFFSIQKVSLWSPRYLFHNIHHSCTNIISLVNNATTLGYATPHCVQDTIIRLATHASCHLTYVYNISHSLGNAPSISEVQLGGPPPTFLLDHFDELILSILTCTLSPIVSLTHIKCINIQLIDTRTPSGTWTLQYSRPLSPASACFGMQQADSSYSDNQGCRLHIKYNEYINRIILCRKHG